MDRVWIASYGLAWLLALAQALTLVLALWVMGRIELRRSPSAHALITDEGPEVHAPMPEFEGRDAGGRLIRGRDYRGRTLVVLLVSPQCAPCDQLLRGLSATRRGLIDPPEFLVVTEASPSEDAHRGRARVATRTIIDAEASIRERLGVERTPYGFLVDPGGVVRMKGVVNDRGQLEGLIRRRGRYVGGLTWQEGEAGEHEAAIFFRSALASLTKEE